MIRQLDVPLRTLAPNRRVYIVRNGLVYQYPARIVRDMANDMWVGPEDDEVCFTDGDCKRAQLAEDFMRDKAPERLRALCAQFWSYDGQRQFGVWWDSVAEAEIYRVWAAAASYAARNVMTWSLFIHRNEVDTSGLGA